MTAREKTKLMDKLAQQLKQDAAAIEVDVSPELDRRLAASFENVQPQPQLPRRSKQWFWWASSLTGVAAAVALVAVINFDSNDSYNETETTAHVSPVVELDKTPSIDWHTESAMLVGPLQKELDALESDLKKAEARVRKEIGL